MVERAKRATLTDDVDGARDNMYRLHTKGEVAKSLGNQAQGVQPDCTMTTQIQKSG